MQLYIGPASQCIGLALPSEFGIATIGSEPKDDVGSQAKGDVPTSFT